MTRKKKAVIKAYRTGKKAVIEAGITHTHTKLSLRLTGQVRRPLLKLA